MNIVFMDTDGRDTLVRGVFSGGGPRETPYPLKKSTGGCRFHWNLKDKSFIKIINIIIQIINHFQI